MLLDVGSSPRGRKEIVEKTGLPASQIQRRINHADLLRVDGIGGEFAELLEASGVDTVPELAQRNPGNVVKKMQDVNTAKKLIRVVTSVDQVTKRIEQAKKLPRKISFW